MMLGLMQDRPLMISDFIEYAQMWHGEREIVSRDAAGRIHRYDYARAGRRTRQLASALQSAGIRQGDRVATLAMNGYRHFELFYGVSGMGAVLHTVNPRLFDEQLIYIMTHAEDRLLFLDPVFLPLWDRLQPQVRCVKRVIVLDEARPAVPHDGLESYEQFIADGEEEFIWPNFDERQASSLCYTSGTTGHPKGVLYSHRSTVLHALAAAQNSAMGLSCDDVILPLAPMFHANAWSTPYLAPMVGAKLVLPGPMLDGESVQSLIEAEGATFTVAVPTIFTMLFEHLDRSARRIDTLKRAVIGGAAVPHAMIDRLRDEYGCRVLQVWGMTETSPLGTMCTPSYRARQLPPEQLQMQMMTPGRVQFGMQLKLVDDQGRRVPHDGQTPGALWVRGSWAASGYYKAAGGPRVDEEGWFPTGDVGTLDALGYLRITDRLKDVIKSGGEWISSIDLENVVYSHSAVKQAAVIGVPDEKWGERPALFVVLKAGERLEESALRAHIAPKLAKWWMPDFIRFVDELPMTATGKIRKASLREAWLRHSPFADV